MTYVFVDVHEMQESVQIYCITYAWKCKWRYYPIPPPQPPHNVIFIVERKKWQQSRASQMPGTKNMSPKHHTYWLCIDIYIYIYAPTNMIHLWYIHIHIECIDIPNIFWALRSNQLTGENHQRPARNPGFLESLSSSALSSTHRPVNQGQPPS